MNSEDGQVYSVCILQFSCFIKYNRMQSKHNQTKSEHSRRNSYSRYHWTKSKNYLKRRYRIRHWIPMFIGTPCTLTILVVYSRSFVIFLQTKVIIFTYFTNIAKMGFLFYFGKSSSVILSSNYYYLQNCTLLLDTWSQVSWWMTRPCSYSFTDFGRK